jgi:hypothetical protein
MPQARAARRVTKRTETEGALRHPQGKSTGSSALREKPMLRLVRLLPALLIAGFGACGDAIIAMPR